MSKKFVPPFVFGRPNPNYTGPQAQAATDTGTVSGDRHAALSDFTNHDDDTDIIQQEHLDDLEMESLAYGEGAGALTNSIAKSMEEHGYGDRFDDQVYETWIDSDDAETVRLSLYDAQGSYELVVADPDTEKVTADQEAMDEFVSGKAQEFIENYRNYRALNFSRDPEDEDEQERVSELETETLYTGRGYDTFKEAFTIYAQNMGGETPDQDKFDSWMNGRHGDDGAILSVLDANSSHEFVRVDPDTEDVGVDRNAMLRYLNKDGQKLLDDYRSHS